MHLRRNMTERSSLTSLRSGAFPGKIGLDLFREMADDKKGFNLFGGGAWTKTDRIFLFWSSGSALS